MWFKRKKKTDRTKDIDLNIKISVKSLILFEALSGKKFSQSLDQADMILLMYSAFVISTGMKISVTAFGYLMENERFSKRLTACMQDAQDFMAQFNEVGTEANPEEVKSGSTEGGMSITEMANALIFKYHIDVNYVMKDMELWELTDFLKGAEAQYKDEMEDKRLWTFLTVAPQIDLKKCKTPEKFFPFPWNKEDRKKKTDDGLKKEEERAKATIGMTF